mmetsp:Transcript_104289/g.300622  ORF Transcript_104289/g.300622 Transcript_104289/m.300622 type:complete len:153 (-) Transcript_104289:268-726(-)
MTKRKDVHTSRHALPAADADLATRVINSTSASAPKYINGLLLMSLFVILLTFDRFPRAENRLYHFHLMYNEGALESVSMFTRFMSTSMLFLCKFIVKSLLYKGRTMIIKMPLIRHVMPKRKLRGFLRRRAQGRAKNMIRLASSLSESTLLGD